jgi:hypothetical protein
VRDGDVVFAGVFVWALAGISVATPSAIVRVVAGALAAVIVLGAVISLVTKRRSRIADLAST